MCSPQFSFTILPCPHSPFPLLTIHLLRKRNSDSDYIMDETQVAKGQIFYDSTYMKLSRIGNSRDRNQMRGYQVMFSAESLSGVCLFATPGSSVHGIFQARILEWVATSSSRGSSQTRDQTHVSCISRTGSQVLHQQRHLGSPGAEGEARGELLLSGQSSCL